MPGHIDGMKMVRNLVERLENGGFTGQQASTLAAVFTDTRAGADLPTKGDLLDHSAGINRDIAMLDQRMGHGFASVDQRFASLEQRLEVRFTASEQRMTIRLGGMMAAVATLVLAGAHYLR